MNAGHGGPMVLRGRCGGTQKGPSASSEPLVDGVAQMLGVWHRRSCVENARLVADVVVGLAAPLEQRPQQPSADLVDLAATDKQLRERRDHARVLRTSLASREQR